MKKLVAQIMKFGVVGVIAFVIDYGLLALLTEAFGVNYLVSATISFTASVVFNYAASMRYVFTHKEGMSRRRAFALGALSGVVEPVFGLPVGEVSKALGRGRHTTRHVEMFPLDEDTYVIDTPGFSSFDTEELDLELKARLPETFPEFAPYLGQCRFVGCSHVKEKGCAVLQAVKDGRIPASRHRSYVRLYDELKDLRDWQHK